MPYTSKEDLAAWRLRNRNKKRGIVEAVKAAGCVDCSESDPVVLEFHHRDPTAKYKTVGALTADDSSVRKLLEEMAKCDVLCANCHLRRHKLGLSRWRSASLAVTR